MQCYNKMQSYQGVGQSVAWSNYQKEAAGRPLSQLCLDGPKRTWIGRWKQTWISPSEPGWALGSEPGMVQVNLDGPKQMTLEIDFLKN